MQTATVDSSCLCRQLLCNEDVYADNLCVPKLFMQTAFLHLKLFMQTAVLHEAMFTQTAAVHRSFFTELFGSNVHHLNKSSAQKQLMQTFSQFLSR
jgi:hypothetical protein